MFSLSKQQKLFFTQNGYLIINNFFKDINVLECVKRDLDLILDQISSELLKKKVITSKYCDKPFEKRLIEICLESRRNFPQHFNITLPKKVSSKPLTPINTSKSIFNLITFPPLLNLVEAFIGSEIYSHPVQHLRITLPKHVLSTTDISTLSTKSNWHQDNGALTSKQTSIITVWIPFTNVSTQTGCINIIPGSHLNEIVSTPISQQWLSYQKSKPLHLKFRDILIMHQNVVHSSTENKTSDNIRISIDLRYMTKDSITGRPLFQNVGFLARSQSSPKSVLKDASLWASRWLQLRDELVLLNKN